MANRRPWHAVPAARSSAPLLKIRLWVVLGLLILCALLGPLAMIVALNSGGTTAPPVAAVGPRNADALAEAVADDYLAGRSTLMPVAAGLSPTLSDNGTARQGTLPISSLVPGNVVPFVYSARTYEVHNFIVRTQTRQILRLSVTVGYDGQGFPVLVAYPSLGPQPLSQQAASVPALDYTDSPRKVDVVPGTYPQVANVVQAWAKAYVTGDNKALGDLTGDPATRNYQGLPSGFVLVGNPTIQSGLDTSTGLIVRVRVGYQASSANGFAASSDFDLLVANPTTQSAAVVAWGPAGQAAIGSGLTAYMNNEQRH